MGLEKSVKINQLVVRRESKNLQPLSQREVIAGVGGLGGWG